MVLIVLGAIAENFVEEFIVFQDLLRYYLNIEKILYIDEEKK